MKTRFSSSYTDKNDGAKVKNTVILSQIDLTKELGNKFVFIESIHTELDRRPVTEEISLPLKDVPKLIKALQKFMRKK